MPDRQSQALDLHESAMPPLFLSLCTTDVSLDDAVDDFLT